MRKVGSGTVSLTFDDGFESIFSVVFPLIDLLKIHATFYIPSRYIGRRGYVNKEQLWQMAKSPYVAIGAHTRSHVRLSQLSEKEQIAEIRGGKEDLEDLLGRAVTSFAYPYGKFDDLGHSAQPRCQEAGFLFACSTERRVLTTSSSKFWLPRVGVPASFPVQQLRAFAAGLFFPADAVRWLARTMCAAKGRG